MFIHSSDSSIVSHGDGLVAGGRSLDGPFLAPNFAPPDLRRPPSPCPNVMCKVPAFRKGDGLVAGRGGLGPFLALHFAPQDLKKTSSLST